MRTASFAPRRSRGLARPKMSRAQSCICSRPTTSPATQWSWTVDATFAEGGAPVVRPQQRYGTIVIVGGGCYGSYYSRQLGRAARAGALAFERVLAVDRDPRCRVATERAVLALPELEIVTDEWSSFFDRYLDAAAENPDSGASDAIVPSPLMPHLKIGRASCRERV